MLRFSNNLPKDLGAPVSGESISVSPTNPQSDPAVLAGFLRRDELAKQLGLSPRTIDRWHALREGPPRVNVGRTILYNVQSVREWLQSKERIATPVHEKRPVFRGEARHGSSRLARSTTPAAGHLPPVF